MRGAVPPGCPAPSTCPDCTQLRSHPVVHAAATRLRPLLQRLRPLVEGWPPCPRVSVVFPHRNSSRWLFVLVAVCLLMMVALSYVSPVSLGPAGWLSAVGIGGGSAGSGACVLHCPHVELSDPTWQPRAVPLDHACHTTAVVPALCRDNNSRSEILSMKPIRFLDHYRNPCWYELLPDDIDPEGEGRGAKGIKVNPKVKPSPVHPYSHNLFACFSRNAAKVLREMAEEAAVRRATEPRPQRLRCLPHFYIAGMPKCGSTDLFRKVMQHPDVERPPMKEPHWWSKNRFGQRLNYTSSVPFRQYVDLFDKAALAIESRLREDDDATLTNDDVVGRQGDDGNRAYHPVVTVDASASTFWGNDEWWRLPENCGREEPLYTNAHYIRRLTPQAKIIVILRNPTERLYSDYLYFTKKNKSVTAFHEDVLTSIQNLEACTQQRTLRSCVYDKRVANGKTKVRLRVGVYHVYVSEWMKVFPREQILILRTEDYSKDIRQTTRQIYQYLGLRPLTEFEEKQLVDLPIANARRVNDKKLGSMLDSTRQALQDFYRPHNQALAQLLQDRRFLWEDVTVQTRPDNVSDVARGTGDVSYDGGTRQGTSLSAEREQSGGFPQDEEEGAQSDATADVSAEADVDEGEEDKGRDAETDDVTQPAQDDEYDEDENIEEEEEEEGEEDYEDSDYYYSDSGYEEDEEEEDEEVEDTIQLTR